MNFEFSAEQDILRDQARSFLRTKCSVSQVRSILEGEALFAADLWAGIKELGWTATTVAEAYGGLGMGHLELCVLAEELGRVLAPVPFSSSVYLAIEALLLFGSETQKQKWLPKLASGEIIGTLALAEGPFAPTEENLKASFQNELISGKKLPVPDGEIADLIVVVAKDSAKGAPSMVLVEKHGTGVKCTGLAVLDPSKPHAEIEFSSAPAEVLGVSGKGWSQLQILFSRAAILFAFEQVGGAQASLDMAKEYALGRYAFGRSIASFQAIKHKMADMYIKVTLARSNCYYGAWALSTDSSDLNTAAATARVSATDAFNECSKENIHIHGGMGFTWEFDCHLYYRRNKLLALNLGSQGLWQDRLISSIEESNR